MGIGYVSFYLCHIYTQQKAKKYQKKIKNYAI